MLRLKLVIDVRVGVRLESGAKIELRLGFRFSSLFLKGDLLLFHLFVFLISPPALPDLTARLRDLFFVFVAQGK